MARIFPTVVKKIIQVFSGSTDADFPETLDVSDSLSGTLGPVAAPDTLDAADMLVVTEFNAQDAADLADALDLDAGRVSDSLAVDDSLSGTLGPVNAPDTLDVTDTLVVTSFNAQESADLADSPSAPVLTSTAQDSLAAGDQVAAATSRGDDSLTAADAMAGSIARGDDSLAAADAFAAVTGAKANDTLTVIDLATPTIIAASEGDTISVRDDVTARAQSPDSVDVGDSRSTVNMTGNLWPDAAPTSTGFTNPANATDTNETTSATCSASSSGIGNLTSNTTNGTLVLSCPNPGLSDLTTITSAVLRIKTTSANSQSLNADAMSMALEYSLNDGSSWTNIATIVVVNSGTYEGEVTRTVDLTSAIGNDWSKVNQLRVRATGSVTSGTGTVVLVGTTTFSFHYARLELTAQRP